MAFLFYEKSIIAAASSNKYTENAEYLPDFAIFFIKISAINPETHAAIVPIIYAAENPKAFIPTASRANDAVITGRLIMNAKSEFSSPLIPKKFPAERQLPLLDIPGKRANVCIIP